MLLRRRDSAAGAFEVMQHRFRTIPALLVAAALFGAAVPVSAQEQSDEAQAAASPAVEAYIRARTAYQEEAEAYWQSIADKRRLRNAKRRSGTAIALDDYVLT